MAEWTYVEDNEIVGHYDLLPKNWKNVSGLNLAASDLPFLKSLGWYPVIKQVEEYDNANYYISDYEYQIDGNQVLEIPILSEKQIEIVEVVETVDFATQKEQFMVALRNERNAKLSKCDWTQLIDVQNLFDDETKTNWLIYRQALRDITEMYFNNDTIDIQSVNWPK